LPFTESLRPCAGHEGEEPEAGILLPDDHDRLVVTATTRPSAQAVVTSNAGDFPGEAQLRRPALGALKN